MALQAEPSTPPSLLPTAPTPRPTPSAIATPPSPRLVTTPRPTATGDMWAPTPPPLQAFQAPTSATTIPTIFTTPPGWVVTIGQQASPGATVEFQESSDLVTWDTLATVVADASGSATCTVRPVRTAYYRAYVAGQLTAPARGVVVPTGEWTGWVVGNGPYSGVTGTFTVPNLVVPTQARTVVSEWVGLDGVAGSSLIQAGVSEVTTPGSQEVTFLPWWEILPDAPTYIDWNRLSVLPGHRVTATIWRVSGTQWGIELTDGTTGQTFVTTQPYGGSGTSADWIVEAPADTATGSVVTLGHFTPAITFTGARFSGEPGAVSSTVPEKLGPIVQAGLTVAVPSDLSGDGFAVAYGSSVPAAP